MRNCVITSGVLPLVVATSHAEHRRAAKDGAAPQHAPREEETATRSEQEKESE